MYIKAIDSKGRCDALMVVLFEQKLANGDISAFFRESEQRWVIPGVDATRFRNISRAPKRRYSDSV